jgi:hypothetical protein
MTRVIFGVQIDRGRRDRTMPQILLNVMQRQLDHRVSCLFVQQLAAHLVSRLLTNLISSQAPKLIISTN